MDITNILGALTGNDAVNAISENLKIDSKQVSSVINNALPSLLGAMQKNASTESGAASLGQALNSHLGDTSLNLSSAGLADGGKILSHILGGNSNSVFSNLAKQTGLSNTQVSGILAAIAPLLLGMLGNNQKSTNTGFGDLGGMLGTLLGGSGNQSSGGLLGSILGGFLK